MSTILPNSSRSDNEVSLRGPRFLSDTSLSLTDRTVWAAHAEQLAGWSLARLVNRSDAFGAYHPLARRGQPKRDGTGKHGSNYTSKDTLTRWKLVRHFRGEKPEHVIGLHTTSPQCTCCWFAFDIDQHGQGDAHENLAVAMRLFEAIARRGFRPLLTTSNGQGGYHLRVILSAPVPSAVAHHQAGGIARSAGFAGERFPKQARVAPPGQHGQYGNWLRLPGRHHSRDYFSVAFDGHRWLDAHQTVVWLLSFAGDDPRLVPRVPEWVHRPAPRPALPAGHHADSDLLDRRISRYVSRCPNLSEGQGRDDVAFALAAWLINDADQPDDAALRWLEAWDASNSPPKGAARLKEILQNAHRYGGRKKS